MKNLILGFIAGAVLAISGNALAQELSFTEKAIKVLKPVYISEKMTLDSLGKLTSDQYEMVMGKLNYIQHLLEQ